MEDGLKEAISILGTCWNDFFDDEHVSGKDFSEINNFFNIVMDKLNTALMHNKNLNKKECIQCSAYKHGLEMLKEYSDAEFIKSIKWKDEFNNEQISLHHNLKSVHLKIALNTVTKNVEKFKLLKENNERENNKIKL